MEPIYYILLATFLGYPILGIIFIKNRKFKINSSKKTVFLLVVFFLLHNLFFFYGYSFRGDYIDYIIFSLEYLCFCLVVFSTIESKSGFVRFFSISGQIAITIGFLFGLIGIFAFIMWTMELESDKQFHFKDVEDCYEVRRYCAGFAASSKTRYNFETYREFNYLPIEQQIDNTDFFDTDTDLDIAEEGLGICIRKNGNSEEIIFESTNGKIFAKQISLK